MGLFPQASCQPDSDGTLKTIDLCFSLQNIRVPLELNTLISLAFCVKIALIQMQRNKKSIVRCF